jgi:uncharacterized BrkB/YihY/UPF0761 family membrane protein
LKNIQELLGQVDAWQRRNRLVAPLYGVMTKFGNDNMNLYVVGLGWYGFLAIYPLLLVVITIFGFIGVSSLGHGIVSTLHQFPVIGSQFNPEQGRNLHGSTIGLVIGLVGLIYGAQGVTQTAEQAMARAWNVPQVALPGFLPRLGRSMLALTIIGGTFVVNAAASTFASGPGHSGVIRALSLIGMLLLNLVCFFGSFRALTPKSVAARSLLPGVVLGSVAFTVLITVGSGLIQHQLRNSSATYGQFGAIIGLVGFLLLMAKLSLYGAELNCVLERHLWPRALVNSNPTEADNLVLSAVVHQQQRRKDQVIGVGFGDEAVEEAARDAAASGTDTDKEPASLRARN